MAPPTAYRSATSSKTTTGFEADSSGDEDDRISIFSTSSANSTVLGFVDGQISSARDSKDWRISRVGGLPVSWTYSGLKFIKCFTHFLPALVLDFSSTRFHSINCIINLFSLWIVDAITNSSLRSARGITF